MYAKSWSEIADEYFEVAEHLTDEIYRNRAKLQGLARPESSREAYRLKELLSTLYAERRNVLYAANYIRRNYCE